MICPPEEPEAVQRREIIERALALEAELTRMGYYARDHMGWSLIDVAELERSRQGLHRMVIELR